MNINHKQTVYPKGHGMGEANPPAERRVVSILYADIVSSTKIIAGLDPDDIPDFLDPAINIMIRAVHTFGGKVMRVQGDGIKAIFGATSSLEHHALLAAYAGQEILKLFKAESPFPHLPRPEVRVGIHSGSVIVRWQQNDFGGGLDTVGTAAHVAAKIEQISLKGCITISEVTANLIQEYARLEKVDSLATEMIAEAGQLYRILSMERTSGPGYKSLGKAHIPIYGRETELAKIKYFLNEPEHQNSNTLTIIGPAGIGKSRILNEIVSWALQKNFRVESVGGVVVFRDSPFFILRKLVMKLLGSVSTAFTQQEAEILLHSLSLKPNQHTSLVHFFSTDKRAWANWDLPTDEKFRAIQTGIAILLQKICMHDPLLLLIEDLHDVDSESLQVLAYLSANCEDIPLSIIVTTRPEGVEKSRWECTNKISVIALSRRASSRLVEAYCDPDLIKKNPNLIPEILNRCEGHPLALLEFSKISKSSDWENGTPVLPLALEPLLRQRLDALSKDEKNLVDYACVLGGEFDSELLRTCMGMSKEEIGPILASLADRKLIFYKKNEFLAFEHNLYQEVGYKSLLRKRRWELHAKAYNTLKSSQSIEPQILAYHAAESNQTELALKHLWLACDIAIGQSAVRTVRNLYYRAEKLCERIGPSAEYKKLKFALKSFDAFHQMTWQGEHLDIYEMALERLESELLPEERALVTCNLAAIKWIGGEAVSANNFANIAYDIAQKINYFPVICYAEFILANTEYSTGQVRKSVDRLKAIAQQFKEEKRATRFGRTIILPSVMYRAFASWYCVDLGELEEAEQLRFTANKIAEIEDHEYSKAICNMAMGYKLYRTGEFREAASVLAGVYQSCLENSYLGVAPMVAGWACLSYLDSDHLSAAENILAQELSSTRIDRVKNSCHYYVLAAKARLVAAQGDAELAITWFARALQRASDSCDKVHQAYGHFEMGRHYEFALEKNITAAKHYQAALKLAVDTEMKGLEALCLRRLMPLGKISR